MSKFKLDRFWQDSQEGNTTVGEYHLVSFVRNCTDIAELFMLREELSKLEKQMLSKVNELIDVGKDVSIDEYQDYCLNMKRDSYDMAKFWEEEWLVAEESR